MRLAFLLLLVPQIAAAQRSVNGTVYDSLLHAPLRGADIWVRGSERHTETDADGRFHLDSIPPGRYTLLVSHPGLDSAGLFTLAVPVDVYTQPRDITVKTDSTGTYYACGVASDMKLALRAYAQRDSSGLVDLQLGRRAIGRQDLTVALAPDRQTGVVRGQAMTNEQTAVWGGRVSVREGATTMIEDNGTFIVRGVTPGTQWLNVQAIGRAPQGLAVDVRSGDTTVVDVTLGPLPVALAAVRVVGVASRMLSDFEERRRAGSGLGYFRGEAEIAGMASIRSVLTSMPSIQLVRGQGNADFMALLPNPGIGGRGWCVPGLYIDGFQADWDQVHTYKPQDLVGVEMYPRAASAPLQYQQVATGCGVVLIWTKYLK